MKVVFLSLPDRENRTLDQVFAGEASEGLRIEIQDKETCACCAHLTLDAKAVEALCRHGNKNDLLIDLQQWNSRPGTAQEIESVIRAQVDWQQNLYEHKECDTSWDDHHSCGCDDECPKCEADISPHDHVQLFELVESETPGVFTFIDHQAQRQAQVSAEAARQRG